MNTKTTILTIMLAIIGLSSTFAQVGIGTTTPAPSSILDLTATNKGFLPPRLTTAVRDAIASPATGLTIYNVTVNCLQWFNGTGWFNVCDGSIFVPPVIGIPNNATCATAIISVTPCSAVAGATLNDDNTTAVGFEYDWTGATGNMSGGTTRALVEIGGQCWFRRNTIAAPTAPCADPINTGCNIWLNTAPGDIGSWGYYNTTTPDGSAGWTITEPAVGQGLLYQWSAAMNGSITERAQGVCPTGWHVPSDCEWMYLENTLGMSTADQESNTTNFRNSGSVGSKLSTLTGSGNNSSGFTALLPGFRSANNGSFANPGLAGYWWSSTSSTGTAKNRILAVGLAGVRRLNFPKGEAIFVRCLKD